MNASRESIASDYEYYDADLSCHQAWVLPQLLDLLRNLDRDPGILRIFDLGCGNGSVARALTDQGWQVTGVDPSIEGITLAKKVAPHLDLHPGSCYDSLDGEYGRFPVVVSLDVIEHVYYPRLFCRTLYNLLEPGGLAIISTPYHGYWKNLALAVTGKMDRHFTALWDNGHIKFWSMKTMNILLSEAGFINMRFIRIGRIPPLAKTLMAIAEKPVQ